MVSIKHQKNTGLLPDWTQTVLDSVIAGNPPPLPPAGTLLSSVVLPSDFAADHVITGDANGVLYTDGSGKLAQSTRFTFDNFLSVTGLESAVTIPPITASIVAVDAGGEYPDGSSVLIRLYPFIQSGLSYLFDPDVYVELGSATYTGDNFYISIDSITFAGADGWVAINNINGAGWLGISSGSSGSSFFDTNENYTIRTSGSYLDAFQQTYQKSAEFTGEVVLKGATNGGGGKLTFEYEGVNQYGNQGGVFSLEIPPTTNFLTSQRLYLPNNTPAVANCVLGVTTAYSGTGGYEAQLQWLTPSTIGSGTFFNLTQPNTASTFGVQEFASTVTSTSSVVDVLRLTTTVGGLTPLAGHGSGLVFRSKASDGVQYNTARVSSSWISPTAASRSVRIKVQPITSIDSSGINIAAQFGATICNVGVNGLEETGTSTLIHTGSTVTKGLVVRGAASQTANLTEWQNSAGTGLLSVSASGAPVLSSTAALNTGGGGIVLYSTADEVTNFQRLRINVTSANIAIYDLQKGGTGAVGYHSWRVGGTVLMEVDASQTIFSGHLYNSADNTKDIGRLSVSPLRFRNGYFGTGLQAGAPANTAIAGSIHGYAFTASTIASVFQGAASQTANLTEWRNNSNVVQLAIAANGRDFVLDATTGTKIGTANTQKLGFWNATPVVQPTAIPNTTGAILTVLEDEVNKIKDAIRLIGLIAT